MTKKIVNPEARRLEREAIRNHQLWLKGWNGHGFVFTREQYAAMEAEVEYEDSLDGCKERDSYYEARDKVANDPRREPSEQGWPASYPSMFSVEGDDDD